jgi:hypothetical protein
MQTGNCVAPCRNALQGAIAMQSRVARIEQGLGGVLVLGHEIAQLLGGDVFALVGVSNGFDLRRGVFF